MDEPNMNLNSVMVPIVIDSVKTTIPYQMTRCTYFSIENNAPAPNWTLNLGDIDIRFLMLGISGVIISPFGGDGLFDTPDKLEHLFDIIEENEYLYVDTNEIWLPNQLLFNSNRKPERSLVYRINYYLFELAFRISDKVTTDEEFLVRLKEENIESMVFFSETETEALYHWNQNQINISKEEYHQNPDNQLPKRNNEEPPVPPLQLS